MCPEIRENLSAYIDGELSDEMKEQTERHLAACDACRQLYDELLAVTTAVQSLPQVEVPEDLEKRIAAQIFSADRSQTIHTGTVPKQKSFYKRLSSIAAIFVVGIFALTMYNNIDKPAGDAYRTITKKTPVESQQMQQSEPADGADDIVYGSQVSQERANVSNDTDAKVKAEPPANTGAASRGNDTVSAYALDSGFTYLQDSDTAAGEENTDRISGKPCRGKHKDAQKSSATAQGEGDSEQALLMNMRCLEKELTGSDYQIKSSKEIAQGLWKFEVIIDSRTVNYLSQDGKIWIETTEESSLSTETAY